MTADPGCKKGALARLEVCTLTKRPVPAIVSSCSLRLLLALNSTVLLERARPRAPCQVLAAAGNPGAKGPPRLRRCIRRGLLGCGNPAPPELSLGAPGPAVVLH
jgi:hypothetical protein